MNIQNFKFKQISNKEDMKKIVNKAYQDSKSILIAPDKKQSHSFDHILRVVNTCFHLAIQLEAYLDVILIAAFFHDVGRQLEEETGRCHAEIGAEYAEKFLRKNNLDDLIQDVCKAIKSHRFSKNIEPQTTEAKILQDADALDALGEIGLYRTISYSCEKHLTLNEAIKHFDDKLLQLPERMHFPLTKKIAEEKCKILHQFKEGIHQEQENSKIKTILEKLT